MTDDTRDEEGIKIFSPEGFFISILKFIRFSIYVLMDMTNTKEIYFVEKQIENVAV